MTLSWLSGPGIIHKPLQRTFERLTSVRRMNCHVAVSEASSIFSSLDESDEPAAHGYVRRGTSAQIADPNGMSDMEQYISLEFQGGADYQGNDATISWETQGGVGDDAQNGEWDAAQVRRLRWLWTKIRREYDLPNKLVETSRLGSEENRGLGWHRIGVNGNFPTTGILRGRLQLGAISTTDPNFMRWSKSWGKPCPGDKRIYQMSGLLAEFPVPVTPPVDLPELEIEDEDMKMIIRQANGAAYLVWGSKCVGISNGGDLEALRGAQYDDPNLPDKVLLSEDIPLVDGVTSDFYTRFATTFGGVK